MLQHIIQLYCTLFILIYTSSTVHFQAVPTVHYTTQYSILSHCAVYIIQLYSRVCYHMMQIDIILCSTIYHCIVIYLIVLYCTGCNPTVQYTILLYDTVSYCTVQSSILLYSTVQYPTVQLTVVCYPTCRTPFITTALADPEVW